MSRTPFQVGLKGGQMMDGCLCKTCTRVTCGNAGISTSIVECGVYCPPKPITNADCIRAMSDEELAEYLDGVCHDLWQMFVKDTRKTWLDWLKQEVN